MDKKQAVTEFAKEITQGAKPKEVSGLHRFRNLTGKIDAMVRQRDELKAALDKVNSGVCPEITFGVDNFGFSAVKYVFTDNEDKLVPYDHSKKMINGIREFLLIEHDRVCSVLSDYTQELEQAIGDL